MKIRGEREFMAEKLYLDIDTKINHIINISASKIAEASTRCSNEHLEYNEIDEAIEVIQSESTKISEYYTIAKTLYSATLSAEDYTELLRISEKHNCIEVIRIALRNNSVAISENNMSAIESFIKVALSFNKAACMLDKDKNNKE